MKTILDCPHLLDYPTFDGVRVECEPPPFHDTKVVVSDLKLSENLAVALSAFERDRTLKVKQSEAFPVLAEIGLLDALREVEAVVAWNKTEKHSDCKWKKKGINYHDAKAVKHLGEAQCNASSGLSPNDHETGRSHRAHAACRLLMSLAHELNNV